MRIVPRSLPGELNNRSTRRAPLTPSSTKWRTRSLPRDIKAVSMEEKNAEHQMRAIKRADCNKGLGSINHNLLPLFIFLDAGADQPKQLHCRISRNYRQGI